MIDYLMKMILMTNLNVYTYDISLWNSTDRPKPSPSHSSKFV